MEHLQNLRFQSYNDGSDHPSIDITPVRPAHRRRTIEASTMVDGPLSTMEEDTMEDMLDALYGMAISEDVEDVVGSNVHQGDAADQRRPQHPEQLQEGRGHA